MKFARFLAAKDKGLQMFEKAGFKVTEGDPWAETPELNLFAGSMLRPAIEQTIIDFEQREGVRVTRVYNGCGVFVAQMKAGQKPDAYSCDNEFMAQVVDLFNPPEELSQNELVILVQKGNPKGIVNLKSLGNPGLRLGIGHEKQCAMGSITQRTFTESGVTDAVMKNVTVQTPTGDMLVNRKVRTGSLDAAVTYLSNAVGAGDKLDALRIQGVVVLGRHSAFCGGEECEVQAAHRTPTCGPEVRAVAGALHRGRVPVEVEALAVLYGAVTVTCMFCMVKPPNMVASATSAASRP